MIKQVVSGGQTGVDRAALDAARDLGFDIGGWCPDMRKAEDGTIPSIYPLTETPSTEYDQRTEWNVRDSDGTVIIARGTITGGSLHTKNSCHQQQKPCCIVDLAASKNVSEVLEWIQANNIVILNVAGPRESHCPGIYNESKAFLLKMLQLSIMESPSAPTRNLQ